MRFSEMRLRYVLSDSKKYYYMRLKEDFFDSEEMVILEELDHGLEFQNIYLQLCLRSLKNDGRLMVRDRIPYSPSLLAKLTRHDEAVMQDALNTFEELGLIEVMDTGAIYMSDIQDFIGASSTEAERKKAYRRRIREEREGITDKCPDIRPDIRPPETEIEIELEIEKKTDREGCPSLDEVNNYCKDRGIDPQIGIKFYNYQDARGWVANGEPIRSWRYLLESWYEHEKKPEIKHGVPDPETLAIIESALG